MAKAKIHVSLFTAMEQAEAYLAKHPEDTELINRSLERLQERIAAGELTDKPR